ncbi:M23 family metallopeptidase [Planomonospora sp. ID67723]|uniref:M23 family metallopeptidase n=1 Tax=Planomonospora sp. ID67723 TaxID=2738134 RepID=UPI0018C44229|nr:M23 family metallopeptidase [Planomonospora sp. ID67723]MBG0830192.1 M23 family metallopeptidase [Planomonospora sp. ID67723]
MTTDRSRRMRLLLSMAGLTVLAATTFQTTGASAASPPALGSAGKSTSGAAAPSLQLPFPCNQQWRLDSWAHAPALDMVKEPNQSGTEGAALVAPAAGTVSQSYWHNNAGNVIQINHGGGWFTTYLHLQSRAVGVGAGVQQGTVIGKVGRTGPTSNNHPHLHFELGYDSNGDGQASWGFSGAERVKAAFNGVTYGSGNNQTFRNVTSRNKCGGNDGGGTGSGPNPRKYMVDIHSAAPGHSSPGGTRTGTLNKGTGYVYCRTRGPKVQVGADYNHWWLKTDLDSGNPWRNQWVSAYYLSRWGNDQAKDNSGNDIRDC